jgi:hypothetical protein
MGPLSHQEHRVAWSGPTSVGTTSPVNVSVDDELRHKGEAKKQIVVEDALEVTEDALHNHEMGLPRIVHVEARLLGCVGDVEPSEGEVPERPGQAAVGSQVAERAASIIGDLGLSVDRCGAELAVSHASALKDVPSVLALVEEKVVDMLHRWDAKKVVEKPEVLHGELLLKSSSGMLEKLGAWGSEDVVDVEQQVGSVVTATVDEQRGVRLGLHEAQGDHVGGKEVVPSSWHLLQTVEGLVEPAHQPMGWEQ